MYMIDGSTRDILIELLRQDPESVRFLLLRRADTIALNASTDLQSVIQDLVELADFAGEVGAGLGSIPEDEITSIRQAIRAKIPRYATEP